MSVATEGGQASAVATQRRKGVTPPSDRAGRSTFVSDVIVELGFVDRATVEEAVQDARQSGKAVPRILLSTGALSEDQLARATAERYGLDHVDLSEFEVDVAASNLISRVSANRYGAVPIAFDEDGALVVAMADPADPLATSDIAVMTKLEVKPVVATAEGIESLLGRLHEVDRSEHGQPGKGPPPAGDDAQAPGRVSGAVIWQAEGAPKLDSDLSPDAAPAAQPAVGSAPVSELQTQVRDLEEKLRVEREEHAATCERLKAEVEEMQGKMVVLLEKLERAERLEGEVATAAAGVGDAEQRAEVASSKVAELEGRLAELEEAHREAEEHAKAELEAALSRTRDAERKAEAATERAGKADAGAEKAEARVSEAEDAVNQAEARVARTERAAKDAEARVARTERAAKDAEARAVEAEAAATAAEERADAAERIGGETAERLSELEGADERAERSRRALAEIREQAEREQELLARREQELEETLRAERSRVERLTLQLAGVADLGDSVGAALEQLATVRDSLAQAGEAAATAPPPQTEPPAAS